MKHPRRAAAVVTGVLVVAACVLVGQVAEMSAPRSTAAPRPIPSMTQATAGPSAEFVVPLYVPAPPADVLGLEDGADLFAPDNDTGVLTPDNVITPNLRPPAPLRAVIRPA